MNRNRKLLIIAASVVLIVVVVLVTFFAINKKPAQKAQNVDQSLSQPISFQNTEVLQKILLSQQYNSVIEELSLYIKTMIGKDVVEAAIVQAPVVGQDGKISFTVHVASAAKDFGVTLDRLTYFDKVIFAIPADNYQKTLQVFGNDGGDD